MTAFMFSCKMNVISYMLYTLGPTLDSKRGMGRRDIDTRKDG